MPHANGDLFDLWSAVTRSASLPGRVGRDGHANLLLGAERRAGVRAGAAPAGVDAELAGNHAGDRGAVRNDLDVPHHSIDSFQISLDPIACYSVLTTLRCMCSSRMRATRSSEPRRIV